jgi:hypothetical protein
MQARWIAIAALAAALPAGQAFAAQEAGDKSFSISGTGASDKNFDTSSFGTTGELGWFLSDTFELGLRQGINILTLKHADDSWSGSTVGFLDLNVGKGPLVPYIGANLGGIYGDHVQNTETAGVEGGLKWYVKDKTFVAFNVQYEWLFNNNNDIDNRFNDGAFLYSIGVGFNF